MKLELKKVYNYHKKEMIKVLLIQQMGCLNESFHLYTKTKKLKPIPERNVANHVTVRKGDFHKGKHISDVLVKTNVSLPQSDHAAMETRSVKAEILPTGEVHIES